jgi:hypothetical protein
VAREVASAWENPPEISDDPPAIGAITVGEDTTTPATMMAI